MCEEITVVAHLEAARRETLPLVLTRGRGADTGTDYMYLYVSEGGEKVFRRHGWGGAGYTIRVRGERE